MSKFLCLSSVREILGQKTQRWGVVDLPNAKQNFVYVYYSSLCLYKFSTQSNMKNVHLKVIKYINTSNPFSRQIDVVIQNTHDSKKSL